MYLFFLVDLQRSLFNKTKHLKLYIKTLIIVILITLCGCNSPKENKKYVIGFSQFTTNDNWHKAMLQSMKIEAQFHSEIELVILDGKESIDNQIDNIDELIDKKVDILIVSPIAPKPLRSIITKATKANIPVIILDREISDVPYKSFIGVDNYKIGIDAAKYIASLKTKAIIVEIKGWAGTTPTTQRSLGFKNSIENNTNLQIVATTQERYNNPGIKKYFKKIITENKEVNFVFAHTDALALEAYEVAKELGIEKKINFIGVGGVNSKNEGLDLIERNILKSSILNPTGGKEAIRIALKIITNQNIEKKYLLPSLIIDDNNIDVLKRQSDLALSQDIDIEKQQKKITNQLKLYASQNVFLKYTLIFLVIIFLLLLLTFLNKRKLSKQKKKLEQYILQIADQKNEIEKTALSLQNLNESTNNFFTGVSHDFKTPISLIISSIESLLTNKETAKPEEYGLIYNNSKRLLRMINQLLDFKRLENKKIRIQAVKTNINDFITNIYNDFEKEAFKRNIDFSFTKSTDKNEVYIDRTFFDNILFNLLSNAFKFTPNRGKISIDLHETDDLVYISIKDSGIGVLPEEEYKIFDQFFQGSNNKQASSGIGLYITREYLKQHNGNIEVFPNHGGGSEFKLYIPKGKSHFKTDEVIIDNPTSNDIDDVITIDNFAFDETKTHPNFDKEKETLLIIEDNTDLREFLKNKLSATYNIHECDGIDAVNKTLSIIPDIIISDVNLPEKSGFEITKFLKEDERTSHIPIIILTALSSSEAHLQGLKNGVDMFLTKPFSLPILNQSLKTLLYNRKKEQHFYKQKFAIEKVKKEVVVTKKDKRKNLEQEFFNKINVIVAKNIDDSSFTVEILAEELKISRVQLYRKTKAVLGINISDYIQNIRLEKSKELLLDRTLTISDVAYSTGFSSPNYFSTSFKNKYNITPNQFKKQSKKVV